MSEENVDVCELVHTGESLVSGRVLAEEML